MKTVKLRKVGDNYVFTIPKELKEKYDFLEDRNQLETQNREEI